MTEKQILCQAVEKEGSRVNLPVAWVDLELLQSSYAVALHEGSRTIGSQYNGQREESDLPSSKEAACFQSCISTVDCGSSSK